MKVLIIGMGHIGKALSARLREAGHTVVGTTTTPAKVEGLKAYADEVAVMRGSERKKVALASKDVDAVIVTAAPDVRKTRTREEREEHYRDVLEETCKSAAAACPRSIFLSSFSVYGDGGPGDGPITEQTPVSNQEEPSAKYYHRAEQAILGGGAGCVLRFPDMYGAPGDLTFPQRVQMAQTHFGGKIIFSPDAPLYAIHFDDVVNAVIHVVGGNLSGIFNVCDNSKVPPTNKDVFDAICDGEGMPRLEFLSHIKAPNRKISADKIYGSGYSVKHADNDFGIKT